MAEVSASKTFDIVIVGAGIIGLSVSRQLLFGSNLSVAIIDSAEPCSGATGAGQGYIWRIHKDPENEKWELTLRSQKLWERLVESVIKEGGDPLTALGWKKTGSLLVGRTIKESEMLKKRLEKLSEAGVEALVLSNDEWEIKEPALMLGHEGSAAFLPDDFQIDARRTSTFIQEGHLLVIKNFKSFILNHGLMEIGYINHQSATDTQDISVSMGATMDMYGNLLLGSSRQFAGFDKKIDESMVNRIWERALEFFPLLSAQPLEDFRKDCEVRVGFRPYMATGRPVIGPVDGLPKLFLAFGHEGEGLSMALGTAEMIADMILGNTLKVNPAPFVVQTRPCS